LAKSGVPQGGHLSPLLFTLFINCIHRPLRHCHLLCFEDNIKLYIRAHTIDDCLKFQDDLNRFSNWFGQLGLTLKFFKCKVMTINRTLSPIDFTYRLGELLITRVADSGILDLGFKFDHKLNPSSHINYVCCKGYKTLGFIMRLTKDFHSLESSKTLYCSPVRPMLEYGAIVWDPHNACDPLQLERVQRRFLRFVSYLLQIPHEPHVYTPVSSLLNLTSLAERRRIAGINFIKGLLCNKVD